MPSLGFLKPVEWSIHSCGRIHFIKAFLLPWSPRLVARPHLGLNEILAKQPHLWIHESRSLTWKRHPLLKTIIMKSPYSGFHTITTLQSGCDKKEGQGKTRSESQPTNFKNLLQSWGCSWMMCSITFLTNLLLSCFTTNNQVVHFQFEWYCNV